MKRVMRTLLFLLTAFSAISAAHFEGEGADFLPKHDVVLPADYRDPAVHTPAEDALLEELERQQHAQAEEERAAAPLQEALEQERQAEEARMREAQARGDNVAALITPQPSAGQEFPALVPSVVRPSVAEPAGNFVPGSQGARPDSAVQPPAQASRVQYDRQVMLPPVQRAIVDEALQTPLAGADPVQERYPAHDVAATRKAFDDEVPNRYRLFPDSYAKQPTENLVGIFDNMLFEGVELDAIKYLAFIQDAPTIIFRLAHLPEATLKEKQEFADLPDNIQDLQDMVSDQAKDLLELINTLHDRYRQYLEKRTIGSWKKQVIKDGVEFDPEQLNKLRQDILVVTQKLEHLYANRQKIMKAIEDLTLQQPAEWVKENYSEESAFERWQQDALYKDGKLLDKSVVMPSYKKVLTDASSKSSTQLKIMLGKIIGEGAGQKSPADFINELDKLIGILRIKVRIKGAFGRRFGNNEFYLKNALRVLDAFKERYPAVPVPSEHAATIYGTIKPLETIAPDIVEYLKDLKDHNISVDEFLADHGIDDFVPESVLEAKVIDLKNQLERGMYTRIHGDIVYEDALVLQLLLQELNERYPQFLSERQQLVVRNTKLPLQMLFYAHSGLGAVMEKLKNELVTIKKAQTPSSQLSAPLQRQRALLQDHTLPPPLQAESIASVRVASDPFAEVIPVSGQSIGENIYQQAINLLDTMNERASLYDLEEDFMLTNQAIAEFVNQLNAAYANPEPKRSTELRSILDHIKEINEQQIAAVAAEDDGLVRQARAYSKDVSDIISEIVDEQRKVWEQIITKAHSAEIGVEPFIDYQNKIVAILQSKEGPDIILAQLRSLKDDLAVLAESITQIESINHQEPVISPETLESLEHNFSDDVKRMAQELNDFFDGAPDTFSMNYLRLYVRKQITILAANTSIKKAKALEFIDALQKDLERQKVTESGQLYAVRLSAMDFAVRMNYIKIIQEAIEYAHYHKFTGQQKDLFVAIKKDILDKNGKRLQDDLISLEASLTQREKGSVVHGTAAQQVLLQEYIEGMQEAFALPQDQQARMQDLFVQLQQELYALGSAGDPLLMSLISTPEEFGLLIEQRVLMKLELILDYYLFEVHAGNIAEQSIEPLKTTVAALKALMDPEIERISTQLSEGVRIQERPLELKAMSEPMEQAAGIEVLAQQAHQKRSAIQEFLDTQNAFTEDVVALRMQAGALLKQPTVAEAQIKEFADRVTTLQNKMKSLKDNVQQAIVDVMDLKEANQEIIEKLQNRLAVLEEEFKSDAVQEEIAVINQEIKEIEGEQKLLDVYGKDLQQASFGNEQTVEFYGQLLRALRGEDFNLLYGVLQPAVSERGLLEETASLRTLELAALSASADEEEAHSVLECTKKLQEIYMIEAGQEQLLVGLNQLKLAIVQAVAESGVDKASAAIVPLKPSVSLPQMQNPLQDLASVPRAVEIIPVPGQGATPGQSAADYGVLVAEGQKDHHQVAEEHNSAQENGNQEESIMGVSSPFDMVHGVPISEIHYNQNQQYDQPMKNQNNQEIKNDAQYEQLLDEYEQRFRQFEKAADRLEEEIAGLDKEKLGKSAVCSIVKRMIEQLEKKTYEINALLDEIAKRLHTSSIRNNNSSSGEENILTPLDSSGKSGQDLIQENAAQIKEFQRQHS